MTPPLKPVGVFDFAALLAEALTPVMTELAAVRAELADLKAQKTAEILDSRAMAAKFGKPTTEAFNRWIARPSGAHVLALHRVDPAGRRYWVAAEVDALVARGRR
jgi:hypothetical protein